MEIYLIRHTTPAVEKGICYGHADLDVAESFFTEAEIIKSYLPDYIERVYSSPLQRCNKLAQYLFPPHNIIYHNDLKELHCGDWELKKWDDIPQESLMPWMNDFVNVQIPGGESYLDLYTRTTAILEQIATQNKHTAIVSHAGVIRSILAMITNTPLHQSFQQFKLCFGCVIKLNKYKSGFDYYILNTKQM